jgi:hypothetical protein
MALIYTLGIEASSSSENFMLFEKDVYTPWYLAVHSLIRVPHPVVI